MLMMQMGTEVYNRLADVAIDDTVFTKCPVVGDTKLLDYTTLSTISISWPYVTDSEVLVCLVTNAFNR